jgi:RNA polymerase-binding transcription factor DksA
MNQFAPQQEALQKQLTEVVDQLNDVAVLDTESGDWIIRTDNIDQTETDENSQADAAEEADERIAIMAELENRYRSIIHALQKLENGTYGICEISGEQIEERRLIANPAARTCVHHMEAEYELPLP